MPSRSRQWRRSRWQLSRESESRAIKSIYGYAEPKPTMTPKETTVVREHHIYIIKRKWGTKHLPIIKLSSSYHLTPPLKRRGGRGVRLLILGFMVPLWHLGGFQIGVLVENWHHNAFHLGRVLYAEMGFGVLFFDLYKCRKRLFFVG